MVILSKKQWKKHLESINDMKKRIEKLEETVNKLNAIENIELRKQAMEQKQTIEDEWFNGSKKTNKEKSE